MSVPLLATKLFFPPPRHDLIPRPRLIERLSTGMDKVLTLVSAPAGFGKTTLLAEWRASPAGRAFPLSWLSLDHDDKDPTRFLTYLVAALQALKPGLGDTAMAMLQSPHPPASQAALTSLINDLSQLDSPSALVLDDYHVITARPVHDALTFMLDHLPPSRGMRLVILTRADPPIPLSRLRARNQLTEIRAAHLRFTLDETAAFLNDAMGLGLAADAVEAIERRTEGWVAGLQLAALSMQGRDDVEEFVSPAVNHLFMSYDHDRIAQVLRLYFPTWMSIGNPSRPWSLHSNSPCSTSLRTLAEVAGARWRLRCRYHPAVPHCVWPGPSGAEQGDNRLAPAITAGGALLGPKVVSIETDHHKSGCSTRQGLEKDEGHLRHRSDLETRLCAPREERQPSTHELPCLAYAPAIGHRPGFSAGGLRFGHLRRRRL